MIEHEHEHEHERFFHNPGITTLVPLEPWWFFFPVLIEKPVVTVAIGADRINGKSPVRRRFFLLVAVMAFQTGRVDLRSSIDDVRRSDIVFV